MKTILVIFAVLISSSELFAQSYHKLVNKGNKWNYLEARFTTCKGQNSGTNIAENTVISSVSCGNGGEARTYSLYLAEDTLIGYVNYTKVICERIRYNGTDIVYAGAIREDSVNQKVFIKLTGQNERLLYSFNAKIGDTLSIDTTYNRDAVTIKFIKSIGNYNFNGFTGKKITICDTIYNLKSNLRPSETNTDNWYEGIGSLKNLFDLQHLGSFSGEMELLCFWNYENKIFQDTDWTVCEYAIYTQNEEKEIESELKVYPIPANQFLRIGTKQPIERLELLNLNGKVVVITKESIIDISAVENGFYILKLYFESGRIATRKIIKSPI